MNGHEKPNYDTHARFSFMAADILGPHRYLVKFWLQDHAIKAPMSTSKTNEKHTLPTVASPSACVDESQTPIYRTNTPTEALVP